MARELLGPVPLIGLSTHGLSLEMTADFLRARTQARLAVLAIPPAEIGLGTELSSEVSQAVQTLKEALLAALRDHRDDLSPRNGVSVEP